MDNQEELGRVKTYLPALSRSMGCLASGSHRRRLRHRQGRRRRRSAKGWTE